MMEIYTRGSTVLELLFRWKVSFKGKEPERLETLHDPGGQGEGWVCWVQEGI